MSELVLPLMDTEKRTEIFNVALHRHGDPHKAFEDFENQLNIRDELKQVIRDRADLSQQYNRDSRALQAKAVELRSQCPHTCQRSTGGSTGVDRCQLCGETFDNG